MKAFLACCVLILICTAGFAFSVEGQEVAYVGGTAPGVRPGSVGRMDTTSEKALVFEAGGSRIEIPYASITSYEYAKELKRRLGVAPAIAVGIVRKRKHKHFYSISYTNAAGNPEVAVFEIPKTMPRVWAAILRERAPGGCEQGPGEKVKSGP